MTQQKQNQQNNPISIDFEDTNVDLDGFKKYLKEHTERQKKVIASEIFDMGDSYLNEIDHKKGINDVEKRKLIRKIIKKSNKYSLDYLLDLEYSDVKDIHDELIGNNSNFLKKILDFFGV